MRYITEGFNSGTPWANAEVREYAFEKEEADDTQGEAWLVEIAEIAKEGGEGPTSSQPKQSKVPRTY